ncbi:MAG: ABC transporter permease [Defluviitaleaceae bacterium]|nr:ABC transporter permease [Defluviitaleaceae bacterium]
MIKKIVSICSFIAFWKIMAIILDVRILPHPEDVLINYIQNFPNIMLHTWYSMRRLMLGIGLALLVGGPIAVAIGYFPKFSDFVSPLVYVFAPIPKVAFLPLVMLFLGIGDSAHIFLIFFVMVFQIIITIRDAVNKIPHELYYPFFVAKCNIGFIIVHIVLPAILPGIFTSIRIGLAIGLSVLFIAETFGTTRGLGFFMFDSWGRLNYLNMYTGILAVGVTGFVLTYLVDLLHKYLCVWDSDKNR